MKPEDLKEKVSELVVLLQELDKLVPNKIEEELITFLQSLDSHPWMWDFLVNALTASRLAKGAKK